LKNPNILATEIKKVMRIDKRLIYVFCLIMLAGCMLSCAPNTLTSSWVDQSFKGPIKGRILVIGVFKNPYAYKIFEDSFANSLIKAGAEAVPSHKYSQGTTRNSKEWLGRAVKLSGAAAILIMHLNNEEKQTEIDKPHGLILGGEMEGNSIDGYHSFVVEKTLVPGNTLTRTEDYIGATLFDVRTDKPIWSASSKSVNLNHLLRTDDEQLERLYIKDMQRDHIL
jgi:hypothetical protein